MTPEKVDEIAQGRVWTGEQARQIGLVDELGGLYKAIDLGQAARPHPADEEVELVVYPPHRSFYEVLGRSAVVAGGEGRRRPYTSDALMELLGAARAARSGRASSRPRVCSDPGKCWRTCPTCLSR